MAKKGLPTHNSVSRVTADVGVTRTGKPLSPPIKKGSGLPGYKPIKLGETEDVTRGASRFNPKLPTR